LNDVILIEKGKLKSLQERRDVVLEKRKRAHDTQDREIVEAQNEGLDPSADFFRKAEETRLKIAEQEKIEDEAFEAQKILILSRISKFEDDLVKDITFIDKIRSAKEPVGQLRLCFHNENLANLMRSIIEARSDLVRIECHQLNQLLSRRKPLLQL
jgi:hypothetical protein